MFFSHTKDTQRFGRSNPFATNGILSVCECEARIETVFLVAMCVQRTVTLAGAMIGSEFGEPSLRYDCVRRATSYPAMASEPNTTDAGIHRYTDSYTGHKHRSGQVHIQTHVHRRRHNHTRIDTEATWSPEIGPTRFGMVYW